MSAATLLWGVLFSSLGLGFFIYGKKQRLIVPLLCSLALMGVPYFITNDWVLVGVGVVLCGLPYFFRL